MLCVLRIVCLLVVLCGVSLARAQDVTVTEKDNNGTVKLGLGRTLTVRLAQTGGTGYRWTLSDTLDASILALATTDTQGKGADTIGGKAAQVFRYTGKSAGTTTLTLALTRKTGDEIEEAETFRLTVEVKGSSGVKTSTVYLSERDNGKSVKFRVGDIVNIRLMSSAGTGYLWTPDKVPIALLQMVGQPQIEKSKSGRVGGKTTQVFRYRVLRSGNGQLRFAFRRGFQKGTKSIRTWQVDFNISR